jgi:hypothetical protein
MATIIPNPDNVPGAVSSGYQRQNTLIFASMVGFCNINMSTSGVISRGSIIEINGSLARSFNNEGVSGLSSIPNNSIFYIYAVPISATEVVYQASISAPTWSTEKCGYYYNANRAVLRAFKDANGNITGVTIMDDPLSSDMPPNSGGTLVFSRNYRSHTRITLDPGWFRYEMTSGLGNGNGGDGYKRTGVNYPGSGAAGVASTSYFRSAVFRHQGGEILIHVGGNGYNGQAGGGGQNGSAFAGDSSGGGGSGSGAGEETYIVIGSSLYTTGKVGSGKGGNGGDGNASGTPGNGQSGTYFGLDILAYQNIEAPAFETIERKGFATPHEDYGGCGGNGAGTSYNDNTTPGGKGGGILIVSPFSGSPGYARPFGDGAAGYCNIYQL